MTLKCHPYVIVGVTIFLYNVIEVNDMFYNFNPQFDFRSVQNNPKFKEFCEANKGKTPQQICQENNLDWNTVQMMLNMLQHK